MRKLLLLLTLLLSGLTTVHLLAASRTFSHPGLLHNEADLARIRGLVERQEMPAMGSYELLRKQPGASSSYRIQGPFEHLARDGQYASTKAPCEADCNAAYYNSLMWVITGDVAHADKALSILRTYASTTKDISGHDAPLCAGLQGFILINAAEILRYTYNAPQYPGGWSADDTQKVEALFRNAFLPILHQHIAKEPYSNGNWGASVNKMLMAIGIFCNDQKLYDEAVDYYYHSRDNGSIGNYIAPSGQIQESGRDQAHCMLGVGVLAECAECAWHQGDDLYGALDNRLMKGYEYLSKTNLGYTDLPFETYQDASGKYCNWTCIGQAGLGTFRSVFEIAYNHYVYRKGLEMPYTAQVLQRIRPEWQGWTCDNPGFGTLLFYLGQPEPKAAEGQISEQLQNHLGDWTVEAPSLQPDQNGFALTDNGIRLQKKNILYNASRYPILEVRFDQRPESLKDGWFRLSYSVNSAPEFWSFCGSDAYWVDDKTCRLRVTDKLSCNGTSFSKRPEKVTLLLDFGKVDKVSLLSITSIADTIGEAIDYCATQAAKTLAYSDTALISQPQHILTGEKHWDFQPAIHSWVSGFWPGILWYLYEATGEDRWLNAARKATAMQLPICYRTPHSHDVGFLTTTSLGNGYRLTGNEEYRKALLSAADSLATLYNPKVGTLLSWPNMVKKMNWPHNTIIDNMLNLELLFWAARNGGSQRLYDIAYRHAKVTSQHIFRPDYSTYHVMVFDTLDGHFIKGVTHQGLADESTWARGQAWAIYGFTMAYRETHDPSFLDVARKAADRFLQLLPADKVPTWDFNAPADDVKDASAAAITASALLELSDYVSERDSRRYIASAEDMLRALSTDSYQGRKKCDAMLMHCTGHHPNNSEIDASIIYGDYYYLEALLRLRAKQLPRSAQKANEAEMTSPDGNLVMSLSDRDGHLRYSVRWKGTDVIKSSALGIHTNTDWNEGLTIGKVTTSQQDTTWCPPYGERTTIRDHYNAYTIEVSKAGSRDRLLLEVRAYDEGLAFRYYFPGGQYLHIADEYTDFTLPEGTQAWFTQRAQTSYSKLPLKGWTDECERPLLLELPTHQFVCLAEAEVVDYVRTKFKLSDKPSTIATSMYGPVDDVAPFHTPWRVVMCADRSIDILAHNDLLLNLNEPCQIADCSWIKPGKAMREVTLSTEGGKALVDFAVKRHLQYIHFDAGWYGFEYDKASDATTATLDPRRNKDNHALDLPAVIAYAKSKGIGVFLYVNQRALQQKLDELLPLYKQWGIAGIKFGFVQVGSQKWTSWMHEAVRKCAEYGLMVDIHDEYRPTGYSRTYPNLMTQEGIRGNEEFPDATHNVTLPFTRYVAGAADYTICYYRQDFGNTSRQADAHGVPRSKVIQTTPAHQLAMSVVYYSPIQFMYWYDKPADSQDEPELKFFDDVSTTWDDTRILQGEVGEFIIVARRKGDDWFLGCMTGNEGRTVDIPLDFLTPGTKYQAETYTDGDASIQTRTHVKCATRKVTSRDHLTFTLKDSGGAAVRFTVK